MYNINNNNEKKHREECLNNGLHSKLSIHKTILHNKAVLRSQSYALSFNIVTTTTNGGGSDGIVCVLLFAVRFREMYIDVSMKANHRFFSRFFKTALF